MAELYKAIGCMSGTSLDGVDIALIETDGESVINPLGFLSAPYDEALRERLRACLNKNPETYDMTEVASDFTATHIPVIHNLLSKLNLLPQDIDIIGFHGQSVHHDPDNGITCQIGDAALLAAEICIDVISDFRSADVQNGGQGAPLIPIYHRALAQNAAVAMPVAIINIGGVANVTWINGDNMLAFDTGPGNAMIDDWVIQHTGEPYDKNGEIASKGNVDLKVIKDFLSLPYFSKKPPKSLDRNDFDKSLSSFGLTKGSHRKDAPNKSENDEFSLENGAATLTAVVVHSITHALSQCPAMPKILYVTGGGRHNQTIMRGLSETTSLPVHSTDALGWNGDAMEAEGFAYMAVRTLLNKPISFPETTGCSYPTIGGKLTKSNLKAKAA
jgi:anhydro-N-acetylmuramic acid kinase